LAIQATRYDGQSNELAECVTAGVAATKGLISSDAILKNALERAGALSSSWIGDRNYQPNATELVTRDRGAILAIEGALL
jgi:hypothetical protein